MININLFQNIKRCSKCRQIKNIVFFSRDCNTKDGIRTQCKECVSDYKYKNKTQISIYNKKYREKNRSVLKKYALEYYYNNIEKYMEYRNNNKEERKKYDKEYNIMHKKEKRERDKKYRKANKEKIKVCQKLYRNAHKQQRKEYDKIYFTQHKKENINYRIATNLRVRLHSALKRGQKAGSAVLNLGCSIDDLKRIFQQKFYKNSITGEQMTWDNYGKRGWHIDHIIPLSYFDLTDKEQIKIACNYKNLQPLWAEDNLKKIDNVPKNIKSLLKEIRKIVKL